MVPFRHAWLLLLLASGCTYRVHLTSNPVGAAVTRPDGEVVHTPETLRFGYRPFRAQTVTVSSPEYRSMELSVRRDLVKSHQLFFDPVFHPRRVFSKRPHHAVHVRLVPAHGPVGTWSAEGEGLE